MANKKRREASAPQETTPSPTQRSEPSYDNLWTALRQSWGPGFSPFRVLYRFFAHQWQEIHTATLTKTPQRFEAAPLVILVVASVSLTLMEYYGNSKNFFALLKWLAPQEGALAEWARGVIQGRYRELHGFAYWSLARAVGYLVIPWLFMLFLKGERPSQYGLSLKSARSHTSLYVTLFLMIFPVVVLASFTGGFQKTYPFYSQASRSAYDFIVFELLYGFQFFTLEYFFRGFLLHSLKRYVGAYAIFYMLVPYCMIHFGKPFSETLGAIGAGIILGTLSLRTGSIWGGFGIHVAVALSMDVLSLWQKGLL